MKIVTHASPTAEYIRFAEHGYIIDDLRTCDLKITSALVA